MDVIDHHQEEVVDVTVHAGDELADQCRGIRWLRAADEPLAHVIESVGERRPHGADEVRDEDERIDVLAVEREPRDRNARVVSPIDGPRRLSVAGRALTTTTSYSSASLSTPCRRSRLIVSLRRRGGVSFGENSWLTVTTAYFRRSSLCERG